MYNDRGGGVPAAAAGVGGGVGLDRGGQRIKRLTKLRQFMIHIIVHSQFAFIVMHKNHKFEPHKGG